MDVVQVPLILDGPREKRCWMCGEVKPIEAFAYRSIATGRRQDHCRECHAKARRAHYEANREEYIERETRRGLEKSLTNRLRLVEYLLDHPCVDCGETDPVVLDFDHRDPSAKKASVTSLANRSWTSVLAEIAKCDVRCANCHSRRTAEQWGWRKARLSEAA